jgi:hypothetical protein
MEKASAGTEMCARENGKKGGREPPGGRGSGREVERGCERNRPREGERRG